MADLQSTFIDDSGFLKLPSGNTANRPASPTAGSFRFNTDLGTTEVYTGSTWYSSYGSPSNPATSAQDIYNNNNSAKSGIYYLQRPGTNIVFPVYCKIEGGEGWTNLNRLWGPYGEVLAGGTRANNGTGFNMIEGCWGDATQPLNGPVGTQAQALTYGCPGATDLSYIDLTTTGQTMVADFGFTRIRMVAMSTTDDGNVVCGRFGSNLQNQVFYNGSFARMVNVCNNNPNRWSDLNPSRFILDVSGEWAGNQLIDCHTACGGSFRMYIMELFLR